MKMVMLQIVCGDQVLKFEKFVDKDMLVVLGILLVVTCFGNGL